MDSEEEAIKELMEMSREQLDLVPFDLVKWICGVKKCNCHTKARNYGIIEFFYHPRIKPHFFNPSTVYFLCSKHWKLYKRLKKNHSLDRIGKRLIDFQKETIIPINKI